jgi:uncharacterized protein (UPF0333 family)
MKYPVLIKKDIEEYIQRMIDKMDQRGQISVEYILIAAIVMFIVMAFGWVVANESELNSVASAVKMGAENGTTYTSIINPQMQPVRVTGVDINGEDDVTIEVRFSSSVESINETILESINNSLAGSGYNAISFSESKLYLQTNRHNYTVILMTNAP